MSATKFNPSSFKAIATAIADVKIRHSIEDQDYERFLISR